MSTMRREARQRTAPPHGCSTVKRSVASPVLVEGGMCPSVYGKDMGIGEFASCVLLTEADAEGEQEAAEEEAGHEVREGVDLLFCVRLWITVGWSEG
jgi:hypothetical protein